MWRHHNICWKWPPFASRQDWTRRHISENPCQYVAVTAWISSVICVPIATDPGISCKTIGRWESLKWIFPAGWSDIPHFICQRGRNSVLFRRPRHFEGTLTTALARSDVAWLFLMGISEREILPEQTPNHRRLERKHHRRNSGSDTGCTGKDSPKYGAPGSILYGRKLWPLPAHVMMSSRFLHNEVSPLQISLQYSH